MNRPRVTLLESQHNALVEYLDSDENGFERAAIALFRRIEDAVDKLDASDRYLCVDVIPFQQEWINSASENHLDYQLKPLCEIYRRCEEEQLVFGFVHNHPSGGQCFSRKDDANEKTLLQAVSNRNGKGISFVALLWAGSEWSARIRYAQTPNKIIEVRHVSIIGQHIKIYGAKAANVDGNDAFARQEAAFGKPFVDMLQSLRVGVVGSGGTGSSVLTLLARSGVGEIVIVDDDRFEASNLNRVRGARRGDVGEYKTTVLKRFLDEVDLPVSVAGYQSKVDESPEAVDALASCDLLFGYTMTKLVERLLPQ